MLLKLGDAAREPAPFGIEREPEPAHGGRSELVARATWFALFDVRSDEPLPNPCGARPRSVVLPCAAQLRVLLEGRLADAPLLPLTDARPFMPALALADGGRLLDNSR